MLDNECMVGEGDSNGGALLRNFTGMFTSRRKFLRRASFFGASVALSGAAQSCSPLFALNQAGAPAPDYRIEIAEIEWELSPKKKIRTVA